MTDDQTVKIVEAIFALGDIIDSLKSKIVALVSANQLMLEMRQRDMISKVIRVRLWERRK